MSLNPDLKSVDCTACGAGLDVLGGGRVTVHICPYCGTELDALDSYRALRRFNDVERPKTPFPIGTTGRLYGVEFTVIGLLQHREFWQGVAYTWLDHQLYSPTHGYAWLTIEDGHLVFSRRHRGGGGWMSERQVDTSEYQPEVSIGGERFRYYETSTSTITYAEGEFTWAPQKDERTTEVTAISDGAGMGFSQTGTERETYRMTYVTPEEAEDAFGVATGLMPRGVHALQSFRAGANHRFLVMAGIVFALLSLLIAGVLESLPGQAVARTRHIAMADFPAELPFTIDTPNRLTRITLDGDASNSWAYLSLELEDPEGDPVFEAGRTVEYYYGSDADGRWTEGTNRASLTFRPEMAGEYHLTVSLEESGFWGGDFPVGNRKTPAQISAIDVGIRSGLSSGRWMVVLAVVFGLIGGYPLFRKYWHEKRRWSGSDWIDED
ncbi:DUF4178 domain-containing protein [Phaeobacter sp. PT47_59]|uniref:DUF4178 domain-containing protein n=1 Tax=Phaeobacter sp. PT47_59 TaxID=3029979 RepID=UPI0023803942|nr:DUF4178 domain-containing protein [Phaeobacter sp. PT47_59]MDE4173091.1 DUF4178 domain-containing protein [Phaeobacter sp. PT47_59]